MEGVNQDAIGRYRRVRARCYICRGGVGVELGNKSDGSGLMAWTGALPYFSESELACKGTGVIKLDMRFAAALPALRAAWGQSLDLTKSGSVCRTPEHNSRVRGHPRSLHLTENPVHPTDGTMAADIPWRDWPQADQLRFARLAYRMGWAVGLHDGFIHVDRRADLDLPDLPKTVFLYGEWSGFDRNEIF